MKSFETLNPKTGNTIYEFVYSNNNDKRFAVITEDPDFEKSIDGHNFALDHDYKYVYRALAFPTRAEIFIKEQQPILCWHSENRVQEWKIFEG